LFRAWTGLRSGTQVEHVPSWLHQIVRNSVHNQIARDRGPTESLPDELADPQQLGSALDARLLARELLAQIAALPERQRIALVKTELEGRSRREIAEDLGLSEGAVRQLVYRGRGALRGTVTALTPYPLAAWVARRGVMNRGFDGVAGLIAPASPGRSGLVETLAAGSAAGGGMLLKGGAIVVAAGALGGGIALREITGAPRHRDTITFAQHATASEYRPAVTVVAVAPGRSGAQG
jgi:RNA polymerase sigma factor (sigma-70 family)